MNTKYDLENRTLDFSKEVIGLLQVFDNKNKKLEIISLQLLRSATSIGANYREANGAISKKEFKHKIFICKKEAKESVYWLELLKKMVAGNDKVSADVLTNLNKQLTEAKELMLIFSKIAASTKDAK